MTKSVDFIFDFGSPNAYLAGKILPAIAARTGATVNCIPALLGGVFKATGNQSPMQAFANVKGKMAYEHLEMMRFIRKHAIPFRMNPHFPVNTLAIMRGYVAAQTLGVAPAYYEAVYAAMWERGLKMDDPAVIAEVLTEAGLDAAAILAASQTPEVKQKLVENTEAAVARGVFGAPTFFVGKEMFFGKERLAQVEEELSA